MILLGVTREQGQFNEHMVTKVWNILCTLGKECLDEMEDGVQEVRIVFFWFWSKIKSRFIENEFRGNHAIPAQYYVQAVILLINITVCVIRALVYCKQILIIIHL